MNTPLMKNLEGRKKDAIILPDGRIFPPATIPMPLAEVAGKFGSYIIKRFQFVQKRIDDIEIRIELDEEKKGVNVEEFIKEIEKNYREVIGEGVNIEVKEVKEVERVGEATSPPLIISKLDKKIVEDVLL